MPVPVAPRRYRVLRVLGTGAISTTFEIVDEAGAGSSNAHGLVCKRLTPRFARDVTAAAMIAHEARVLELLAGRGAPRLVSFGQDEHGAFVVTERVPGLPLRAHSEAGSGGWARVAAQAFAALAVVHDAAGPTGPLGIVHGDVSPDNVIVATGAVVLVDFGLSTFEGAPAVSPGTFRGTLLYAAPEVARGAAVDARADLFALAASIFHGASGIPPRSASTPAALLLSAGQEPLDAYARAAAAALPETTARALARCLAFRPEDRPTHARDVLPP